MATLGRATVVLLPAIWVRSLHCQLFTSGHMQLMLANVFLFGGCLCVQVAALPLALATVPRLGISMDMAARLRDTAVVAPLWDTVGLRDMARPAASWVLRRRQV